MNQHIQEEQREQVLQKRATNIYDRLELSSKNKSLLAVLDGLIKKEGHRYPSLAESSERKNLFSNLVGVFSNKLLKEALLIVHKETAFLFTAQPN
mmetsp:Transcript_10025/g.15234  ORF Transcript_10025/g.15234 Transcript_10025/m.15234 type:complete len:95 (-) Transcript_10025:1115-1399(-)